MGDLGNDVVLENTGTIWDNNAANGNVEEGSRILQVVRIRNKTTETLQEKLKVTLKFFTTGFQKSVKKLENVRNSATWIEYVPCKVFLASKRTWRFRIRTRDYREDISGASLVTFVKMAISTTLLNHTFSHSREVLMSKRKQLKSKGKGNRKCKAETLAHDDFIKLRESTS